MSESVFFGCLAFVPVNNVAFQADLLRLVNRAGAPVCAAQRACQDLCAKTIRRIIGWVWLGGGVVAVQPDSKRLMRDVKFTGLNHGGAAHGFD